MTKGTSADLPAWKVLIPDGDSPFALLVAQCLKRGNPKLQVHATYIDRRALTRYSRYVDRTVPLDPLEPIKGIMRSLKEGAYDVLLPVSGPGIELTARYAEDLAAHVDLAPVPTHDQIAKVNDKWLFHLAMQEAGIPTPVTALVDSPSSLDTFHPEEPVLLKPRIGSGGIGIKKFGRASDLRKVLHEFIRPGAPYIVQRFVEGHDIDRSVLCIGGKVVASTVQQPVHASRGFAPSSALHFHRNAPVEAVVDGMMAVLGWNGIAHVDLRVPEGSETPVVIEVNPRYWSTLLGSLVAGTNFPWAHVKATKGVPVVSGPNKDCHYVSFNEWPAFLRRHGTSLSQTGLFFGLADPLAILMKKFHPSSALGSDLA